MPEPESNTRAITPLPASPHNATTPERVRQVELNRLRGRYSLLFVSPTLSLIPCSLFLVPSLTRIVPRQPFHTAKAKRREEEASSSSVRNPNNKRPLAVVPATSNSPTRPTNNNNNNSANQLRRDSRLGKYFDYDLSKMVNSKGGFLVEDDGGANDDLKTKERERERERAMQSLEPRTCCTSFTLPFHFRLRCGRALMQIATTSCLPRCESQPQMS